MINVILYTTDTCPFCHKAKDYLEEKGVDFTVKNVQHDSEARKEFIAKGHAGVPVIVIGEEEVVGFDQAKIDSLLGL